MEPSPEQLCKQCNGPLRRGAHYCSRCGTYLETEALQEHMSGDQSLKKMLWLYGSLLAFVMLLRLAKFVEGAAWNFAVDILFSSIILGFAVVNRRELIPLFSFREVKILRVLAVVGISVLAAGLVMVLSDKLQELFFHSGVFSELYLFNDTSHPLLFSVLSIGVQPAIFEEIGFRGIIYNQLNKAGDAVTALLVSSFMFAILHLSVISLFWLVPAGLAQGWLRKRYNTLWLGVFSHFCYNSTIVLVEFLHNGGSIFH